ncbi:hypothetical protein [Pseudomonas sp.]|uniref:hypothetical protein n=1 Tax=Pseudomonas sp. TaxID=306 RepID=UPI003BB5C1AB
MLPAELSLRISILDGCEKRVLPDWAASLVWLGAWCRSNQMAGHRLIVFAVLPSRELAAAFAGLGCIVAGSSVYEEKLSWPKFRSLPLGIGVFFINNSSGARYGGDIIGFREENGEEFIEINITKAAKRSSLGVIMTVNKRHFDDYQFTENKPPSAAKAQSLDAAGNALETLVGNSNYKWLWSDTAEGLIVTSVTSFENSIENLSLLIDSSPPIAVSNFLCLGRNKDQAHAKLRIDHPRGSINGDFPLAILDGGKAFSVHEHVNAARNILVILDRSEYVAEVHDIAKSLGSISQGHGANFTGVIPDAFAAGIEIAAYLIDDL